MTFQTFFAALKRRTILLFVAALLLTAIATWLEFHRPHGCTDSLFRPVSPSARGAHVAVAPVRAPRLLRVQEQDEGAPTPSAPACPDDQDLAIATAVSPWLAVALWVGFAASLQVDLEGRRRHRRGRRSSSSAVPTPPSPAPGATRPSEKDTPRD